MQQLIKYLKYHFVCIVILVLISVVFINSYGVRQKEVYSLTSPYKDRIAELVGKGDLLRHSFKNVDKEDSVTT